MLEGHEGLKPADFRSLRRLAVQFAYQQDASGQFVMQNSALQEFVRQSNLQPEHFIFFRSLMDTVFKRASEVDSLIEKNSKNWKLSRISRVDLAVLRVATTELIERRDIDIGIVTSEATSIAQEYGSYNSSGFVNAVLDAIAKSVRSSSVV